MIYIGIDPGASGGIAILGAGISAIPMPDTEADIYDVFSEYTGWVETFAIIEEVHAMPGNGVSGMFKFGKNYGGLRMALVACGIPFEAIRPQVWQKALGIPSRKKTETQTQWKNRLKAKAQELFPKEKITLSTCDALLIAEYCRRTRS